MICILIIILLVLYWDYNPNRSLNTKDGRIFIEKVSEETGYSEELAKIKIAQVLKDNKSLRNWRKSRSQREAIIELIIEDKTR